MASGSILCASSLLLRCLRDPTVAARHRLLSFLVELPTDLRLLEGSSVEFLQRLISSCALAEDEAQSVVLQLCAHLQQLQASSDAVLNYTSELFRIVAPEAFSATNQGQADVAEGATHARTLFPVVNRVDPSSAAAIFLRRVAVEIASGHYEGVVRVMQAAARVLQAVAQWAAGEVVDDGESTSDLASDPSTHEAYVRAVLAGDVRAAEAALHAHFDTGYGTALKGGAATKGTATALALLAGNGFRENRLLLNTPQARLHELLVSSASAPPAGGSVLGRTLLHYALLAHASLHASVGAYDEASDALAECTRAAQACGDAPAAAYALLQSAELRLCAQRSLGEEPKDKEVTVLDRDSADMLRRAWSRSSELGLWRQQVRASIQLIEGTLYGMCRQHAREGREEHSNVSTRQETVLLMPDWLSVDPFTSIRPHGYCCGGSLTARSAGLQGSSTARSGITAGSTTFLGALAGAVPTPTITLAAVAQSKEGLGASILTAITSPTVTSAVSLTRRQKAISERRPSLGGTLPSAFLAAESPGAAALPQGLTSAHMWSVPLPLSWSEVVRCHGEAAHSRARMWQAMHGQAGRTSTGKGEESHTGQIPLLASVLLSDAAKLCAVAATAGVVDHSSAGHATFDLNAALHAIGCQA